MVLHNVYDFESFGSVSSHQYLTAAFMANFYALFPHQILQSLLLQLSVFYHCLRSNSDLTEIAKPLLRRGGNCPSLSGIMGQFYKGISKVRWVSTFISFTGLTRHISKQIKGLDNWNMNKSRAKCLEPPCCQKKRKKGNFKPKYMNLGWQRFR